MNHMERHVDTTVVIDRGQSKYVIVIGGNADAVEQFAAEELQKYLERMTGVRLQIAVDPSPTPAHYVSIGETLIASDAHFKVTPRHRFDDGFVVRNRQGNLLVRGACARGTLFAIYALLERWGCRWFAPDFAHYHGHHELVPEVHTITFDRDVWVERPAFELRGSFIEFFLSDDAIRDIRAICDWLAKVRKNYWGIDQHPLFDFRDVSPSYRADFYKEGLWEAVLETNAKRGLVLAIGGHGFFTFLPPKAHFEKHPEWFALVKGERRNDRQFCVSNHEAQKTYVDNYMGFVREHPEIDIFVVMPNDGLGWCECDGCQAMGSVLNQYLRVFNQVAVAAEEHDPKLILQALFYAETGVAPNEQTEIHSTNTMGWYCNFSRNWNRPIFHEAPGLEKSDYPRKGVSPYSDTKPLERRPHRNYAYWSVINKWLSDFYNFRIMAEDHYRKVKFNSYPCIKPHMMALDFPAYRKVGVSDIYLNYMEPGDWYTYEPTHYFHARLAWDPIQDVDLAIADYAHTRYPGAGQEMVSYLTNIEDGFNQFDMPGAFDNCPVADLERALEHFATAGEALDLALEKVSEPGAISLLEKNVKSLRYARDGVSLWHLARTGKKEQAIAIGSALVKFLRENLDQGLFLDVPGPHFMLGTLEALVDKLEG